MIVLIGSNVISPSDLFWLLFLHFGVPAILLIGVVVLIVLALRKSKK